MQHNVPKMIYTSFKISLFWSKDMFFQNSLPVSEITFFFFLNSYRREKLPDELLKLCNYFSLLIAGEKEKNVRRSHDSF